LPSTDTLNGTLPRLQLAPMTTLGVGGVARWFMAARTTGDVRRAHKWCASHRAELFVLGGGSNLVIADEGFDGLVLHIALRGVDMVEESGATRATAMAGESWDGFVQSIVGRGLAGVECLSGIPGLVGGTPIQNVGAYGQDVSQTIERVVAYDVRDGRTSSLSAADCGFSYRMSRFKAEAGRFIVCEVTFRLSPGSPTTTYADVAGYLKGLNLTTPTLADVRAAVLDIRRRKGMVLDPTDADTRSVGSFFMNPVVTHHDRERIASSIGEDVPGFASGESRVKIPAAWLIERAGVPKGFGNGPVRISTKHPLAIVNCGGASSGEIVRFAAGIKRRVADRFGVWLRPEPVFVGFASHPDVDYLLRAEP
jgi:UDP-N-acetylmuramate dehydrogenase